MPYLTKDKQSVYIVGVTGNSRDADDTASWLNYLPREVRISDTIFKFVQGGGVTVTPFTSKGYISDHDFMIVNDFDSVPREAKTLMDDRCVSVYRPYKFEYMTKLFMAAKKVSEPIEVMLPIAWNSSCDVQQDGRVKFPKWCNKIICKSMSGAVGEDQCIVDTTLFSSFVSGQSSTAVEKLETEYPTVKFFWSDYHKNEEGKFKEGVKGFFHRAWMALPYIPDVHLEFRMLVGGNEFVVYKRNRVEINGEMRIETSGTVPLTTDHYPDYEVDQEELEREYNIDFDDLRMFAHYAGITTGSIDFYIRKDPDTGCNVLGVFECCSQYGTTYVPLETRERLATGFATYCAEQFYDTLTEG